MGGKLPVTMLWMDARPEEMLMTRGLGEWRSRGMERVVSSAAEVMFVLKMRL